VPHAGQWDWAHVAYHYYERHRWAKCTLLGASFLFAGGEVYRLGRAIKASGDLAGGAFEYGKAYMRWQVKHRHSIGKFGAAGTLAAITGGCLG
jgi:hypothetical protein